MSGRLLTIAEVAARLGVSARTVRRRIQRGALPVFHDGAVVRVPERDVSEYIARLTRPAAPLAGPATKSTYPTRNHPSRLNPAKGGREGQLVKLWDR